MNNDICEWCGIETTESTRHKILGDCLEEMKRQRQSVLVRGIYYTPQMVEKLLQEKENKSRD